MAVRGKRRGVSAWVAASLLAWLALAAPTHEARAAERVVLLRL